MSLSSHIAECIQRCRGAYTFAVVLLAFGWHLSAQPLLSEQEESEEYRVIRELMTPELQTVNQAEVTVSFPERSASVASFIRTHMLCTDRVAIFLMRGGFRHTVLITRIVSSILIQHRIPVLGIIEGERAWIDAKKHHLFDFPVITDTTTDLLLFQNFGISAKDMTYSPCWLTVWSCEGELLYYFNLYQADVPLDSLARLAATTTHLPSPMRAALHSSAGTIHHNRIGGYNKDSISTALPQAVLVKTLPVSESYESGLGKVTSIQISRNGRWYCFGQGGTTTPDNIVYDSKQDRLLPIRIDSVFFRQQSPTASDSLFNAMRKQNYIQVVQPFGASFDPCVDSILYIPLSYGMIESVVVKHQDSAMQDTDTTITISKTNWIAVYDVVNGRVIQHIPYLQDFNRERFGFTERYHPLSLVSICRPPLFVTTLDYRAYPRGYRLSEVLASGSDPRINPTTIQHEYNAPLWSLLDKQTGKCLGFGGQLGVNKRMLGIGYLFIPLIRSCEDAAILHDVWTDYVWIAPDGIRHRIKSYYNPSLVSPSKQAVYPASHYKINLLSNRAWASVVSIGITSNKFMLLWKLREMGITDDQSTTPMILQLYDRESGALLGECTIPVTYDGMKAVVSNFDGNGNLHVLYQDYRRSVVQQFRGVIP